jgi:Phenazine biosynthesis-like protein
MISSSRARRRGPRPAIEPLQEVGDACDGSSCTSGVLRPRGRYGNQLGVVLDGLAVRTGQKRRALAARLGLSRTFVDDARIGAVDIYTPSVRLPFAAHPLVGTSWLLHRLGTRTELRRLQAGPVPTWQESEFSWITGRPQWVPGRQMRQCTSPPDVDSLPCPPPGEGWLYAWARQDQAAGRARARDSHVGATPSPRTKPLARQGFRSTRECAGRHRDSNPSGMPRRAQRPSN